MTSPYVILPTIPQDTLMSWFVFVIRLNDLFDGEQRDRVLHELRGEGIGCNNYFPPIHLQPYMIEKFGFKPGDFPVCEYIAARTLALPFFSHMTSVHVDRVCQVLEKTLEKVLMGNKPRF